jgi:hypothetical protein
VDENEDDADAEADDTVRLHKSRPPPASHLPPPTARLPPPASFPTPFPLWQVRPNKFRRPWLWRAIVSPWVRSLRARRSGSSVGKTDMLTLLCCGYNFFGRAERWEHWWNRRRSNLAVETSSLPPEHPVETHSLPPYHPVETHSPLTARAITVW